MRRLCRKAAEVVDQPSHCKGQDSALSVLPAGGSGLP